MGNNPSSQKPATSQPGGGSHSSGQDSPRPVRKDAASARYPMPVHNQRVAAPPEPSLENAHGSTIAARSKGSTAARAMTSSTGGMTATPAHPIAVASGAAPSPASSSNNSSVSKQRPVEAVMSEPSKPVKVPGSHAEAPSPYADSIDASTLARGSMQDMSYLTRPPRLPLPIEEEIHTPGSPIMAGTDIGDPVEGLESLDADDLTRKGSSLSTTTMDEDDAEELIVDKTRPSVPTKLEWLRGGDRIYVTGSIFGWNRKHRLHPVEGHPGTFAATINIWPGTHHVRFLVDNVMQTSPDLPTTVDFGNNLVNYIEVNADDITETSAEDSEPKKEAKDLKKPPQSSEEVTAAGAIRYKTVPLPPNFAGGVPKYLSDFDQIEDSAEYLNANAAMDNLASPPSLPGFLGKPILNAATSIKDDNSVLNMPNHTVLNHLATSSIKNATLAVSATTRYKSKYVTTIIYKSTESH